MKAIPVGSLRVLRQMRDVDPVTLQPGDDRLPEGVGPHPAHERHGCPGADRRHGLVGSLPPADRVEDTSDHGFADLGDAGHLDNEVDAAAAHHHHAGPWAVFRNGHSFKILD